MRNDATEEQKLKALEEILTNEIGRKIHFEKRTVEQQAIIATGRFQFQPMPNERQNRYVLMFLDDFAENDGGGGGTVDSLYEFLETMGNRVNMPVFDETETTEDIKIPYLQDKSAYLSKIEDPNEKAEKLIKFLDNITLQTNLHFRLETRPIEKWFVVESEASKNPVTPLSGH